MPVIDDPVPNKTTNKTERADTPNKNGYSRLHTDFLTTIGVKTAEKPNTNKRLQVLLPITLPIATLALLCSKSEVIESDTETASSGQLVPIATTVKPIINSGI